MHVLTSPISSLLPSQIIYPLFKWVYLSVLLLSCFKSSLCIFMQGPSLVVPFKA